VCKILIVDDDDDLRDVLRVFLSDLGHDVHESSDGREALVWLSRHRETPPCVAIFDLRMPTVDGWDLLATVRRDRRWRELPVVVLSGTIQRGEYPPVLEANGFWPKPVDLYRLERVHKHCPAHRNSWRNKTPVLEGEVELHRLPSGGFGLGATADSLSVTAILQSGFRVETGPSGELRIYSSQGDMTIEAAIQAGFVHLLAS
jgi:CheY-like chemotaxis protein